MNLKPLLATLGLLAIAAVAFSPPVAAESRPTEQIEVTREMELRQLAYQMLFHNINLSTEQQGKLNTLFHQAYTRVERLLSPQQLDGFHATFKEGTDLKAAIAGIQLTPVQEIQLQNLIQTIALQATPIFTPTQRSQIEQNFQVQMAEQSANPHTKHLDRLSHGCKSTDRDD